MAVATTLKIGEEGLKNYTIIFEPKSNERFVRENLYQLTGRERDELMGYKSRCTASMGKCSQYSIKKGKYPAFRMRLMLINSNGKIDPTSVRTDFEYIVECRFGNVWAIVDKNTENAVWDAVCDGL